MFEPKVVICCWVWVAVLWTNDSRGQLEKALTPNALIFDAIFQVLLCTFIHGQVTFSLP